MAPGWQIAWIVWVFLSNIMLLAVIIVVGLQWLAPPSLWMVVKKVYVHDSIVGQSPPINMDASWYAYFFMRWHTDIKKAAAANDEFVHFCNTDGATLVYSGRKVPSGLNLDMWTRGVEKCKLPVGTYYMETTWEWNYWLLIKSFSVDSNVFRVLPADTLLAPQ